MCENNVLSMDDRYIPMNGYEKKEQDNPHLLTFVHILSNKYELFLRFSYIFSEKYFFMN